MKLFMAMPKEIIPILGGKNIMSVEIYSAGTRG
jgi:hypothetical protein